MELKQIKKEYMAINALTQKSLQSEIDLLKAQAYTSELMMIIDDNDGDIDVIENYTIDDLVIDDEKIYDRLVDDRFAALEYEMREYAWMVRIKQDIFDIKVEFDRKLNLVYRYNHFRSNSYSKVKNHYLKKQYRAPGRGYLRVSDEIYKKQKEVLKKVLTASIKKSTVNILREFYFLDHTLRDGINRLYYSVNAENYNYLHCGEEIHHALNRLQN
jgi:hypothetical protein